MAYTGYLVSVFMDANPYSPTYGQEREERQYDTGECPVQLPANYVQVFTYCEMNSNGSYTGNCVIVYEDVEPLSPTYGDQMETVYTDHVLCEPDSDAPDWEQFGETYCEQIEYQPSGKLGNSGYLVLVEMDMNEYSPTYQQTRETKTQDIVHCTPPSTEPVWITTRSECELENGVRTGNMITYKVNVNEYSPDYNFGEEEPFVEQDLVNCPKSEKAPDWQIQSATCEQEYGYNTGYIIEVYRDDNSLSDTYNQTKTVRRFDDNDCPVQTPDMMNFRIIDNRSSSTDTITSVTLHFNSDVFEITASGSLAPAGGVINGSVVIPQGLKGTGLVCEQVDVSPNTSLPTVYQFSQTPNPYTWNDDYASALVITLWDGDGTGPMWTEVSYTCETVSGYRTGAAIVVEEDMNPDSSTYGETRTRTIEYDSRCPAQTDANWVETSWTCQQENGYNTGNKLSVQTDTNPNSSTYNQTRTRIIQDLVNCPVDTTAAWAVVSSVCEQEDGFNTGNIIVTERDVNPGSSTYNETRVRTYEDTTSCPVSSDAVWVEESWSCVQEQEGTSPVWHEVSTTCHTQGGYNTGISYITEVDINPNSSTFNTTRTRTVFDDFINCPLPSAPSGKKLLYSTTGDTSGSIACDATGTISGSEISTSMKNNMYIVSIGQCVTEIGYQAFKDCRAVSAVVIPSSVTTVNIDAFWNCNVSSVHITDLSAWCNITFVPGGVWTNPLTNAGFLYLNGSRVTDLVVPSSVTSIGYQAFDSCLGLHTITIPDTVTSIGGSAFVGCSNATTLTIGTGVTSIGAVAFNGCSNLNSITINATTPPTLGANTYGNYNNFDNTNNCPIYVPAESVAAYKAATGWSNYASRIQAIPNS